MSLSDVLLALGIPAILVLGLRTVREAWSGERSLYQDTWVVRLFIGRSGRDGVNAMFLMPSAFVSLS